MYARQQYMARLPNRQRSRFILSKTERPLRNGARTRRPSESEDMIGVRCAMNDSGEITTFCRRDQEAELRVLAHTLLLF